ncbi:ankyrin repeat-like protein, putative [Medicago truncatula]|uniref:Ankyrin repeat-like protein, putative n=1 Tax=Medicago truncatula TaxID=3880 RepID=G7IF07_MEDTR|nr:ankyrin repeat-like protein, putative [Medicago truncatula]
MDGFQTNPLTNFLFGGWIGSHGSYCHPDSYPTDKISSVIDRRDVPGRETSLAFTVHLRDPIAIEILMSSDAALIMQNKQGWSALQKD